METTKQLIAENCEEVHERSGQKWTDSNIDYNNNNVIIN